MPYSIVVVTWECADYLAKLVKSMNEHLEDDPQLVVIDNASSDEPRPVAERWRAETTYVQLDENLGFGRASNIGVREARHDAVVLLNPDTELVDGSIAALAYTAIELGALVGPRVLNPDGSIQPSASGSPVGIWPWVNAFVPGALMPKWMQARTEPWRLAHGVRVTWLTGCCIAAPRSVLLELGPFDPGIELYSEDLDLGLCAARRSTPSYFRPDVCRLIHFCDGSSGRRFADAGLALSLSNRSRVLRAWFGPRAEAAAMRATFLNFRLRLLAKRLLRRPAGPESAALAAWGRIAAELGAEASSAPKPNSRVP